MVGTPGYTSLVSFIALQLLRTSAAIKRVRQSTAKLAAVAFKGEPPPESQIDDEQALILSLGQMRNVLYSLKRSRWSHDRCSEGFDLHDQ